MKYPHVMETLVDSFRKLPGVGLKSAERMAYQILEMPLDQVEELAKALIDSKTLIRHCSICGQLSEQEHCEVCRDDSRTSDVICVVQSPKDAFALERAKEYHGRYHILHGVISPSNGVGPQDINIASLLTRVRSEGVKEVILATNPNIEGETTAYYIAKLLEPYQIAVTRLAYGLPVGGNLDYADEFTLLKAIEGRRKL